VGAVRLDRPFRGPEFTGNLFVEQPTSDEREHLALSPGETCKATMQLT
jgi:hypothetical protein